MAEETKYDFGSFDEAVSSNEYDFGSFDNEVKKKEDSEVVSEPSVKDSGEGDLLTKFLSENKGQEQPTISLQEEVEARKPQEAPKGIKDEFVEKAELQIEKDIIRSEQMNKKRIALYNESLSSAKESIAEQRKQLEQDYPESTVMYPTTTAGFIVQQGDPEFIYKSNLLDQSEKYINEIEAILEANNGKGGLSAAKLKTDNFEDLLTLGWTKVFDSVKLKSISDKIRNEEQLSEQETAVLALYGFKNDVAHEVAVPLSYDVVGGVIDMIPYMANVAMTSGIGTGVSATTGKVIKEGTKKAITKYAARGANYLLGKSVQTFAMPMLYEGIAERQVGQVSYDEEGNITVTGGDTPAKAFMKSYGSTLAEIGVEGLRQGVFPANKVASKAKITEFIKKEAQFGGFGEELAEEFVTSAIQAPIEGQTLEETFTPRMIATTALTVGIMSGTTSAVNYVSGGYKNEKISKQVSKNRTDMVNLGNALSADTKKSVDDIIDSNKTIDEKAVKIEQLVDKGKKEKEWSEDDVMTVFKYADTRNKDNAFNNEIVEQRKTESEDVEPKVEQEPAREEKVAESVAEPEVETIEDVEPKAEEDGKKEKVQEKEEKVEEPDKEKIKPEQVEIPTIKTKKSSEATAQGIGETVESKDIIFEGEKVGYIEAGTFGNDIRMNNIRIDDESKMGIGIGKQSYINLNEEAKKKGGVLFSSETMSPEAENVWKSLESDGLVEKVDDIYKFKKEEYAKGYEGAQMREEGEAQEGESVSDKDLSEVYGTKLQDGTKVEEKVKEPTKPNYIGVTNSYTNASRITRGEDPIIKEAVKSNKELWGGVLDAVDKGDLDPRAEVKNMFDKGEVTVSKKNQAVILYDRVRIANERSVIESGIEKAQAENDLEAEVSLYSRLAELNVESDMNDKVNTKMGEEWGGTGQFRQRLSDLDYSLAKITREAKLLTKGGNLTTAQEAKFKELSKKYEDLRKEQIKLQEKVVEMESEAKSVSEEERKAIEKEIIENYKNKAAKERKQKKLTKEKAKAIADKIRSGKLKNQDFTFATIVPPQIIDGAIEVIAKAVEVTGSIAQAIQDGIKYIRSQDWYKKLTNDQKKNFETEFTRRVEEDLLAEDKQSADGEYSGLIDRLVEQADGEFHEGLSGILNKIAYNRVRYGIDTIDGVVNDIYNSVKDVILGVSKRDIRDGISGYGKFRKLSKDEVDVKIRELKRQGRLDSALEDVRKEDKLPLRSGVQRDKKSSETRRKERDLAQEIKNRNLVPESTDEEIAEKWRSSEDAYKRRLENAIEDVKKEIETKTKREKAKPKEYTDPEIIKLKSELEVLKDLRDEVFGVPKKTPEQKRIDAVNMATKKAIDQINIDIIALALGNIPPGKKFTVRSVEGKEQIGFGKEQKIAISNESIDALKQLRDSLKQQLSDMLPESIKDEARLDKYRKSRERRLAQLEEIKRTRDYGEKVPKKKPPLDKETEDLNRKIERVKFDIEQEKEKIRLENRSNWKKAADFAMDVFNLPKLLVTTIDLSAPFTQGVLMIGKPKQFSKAFIDMFRHAFSQKYHDRWLDDLRSKDIYYEMKENGLYIAEPTARLSAKEEQFMSRIIKWIEKYVPVYGWALAGSERAYIGFLNKLRTDVYANFKYNLELSGITGEEATAELKSYANFINHGTGRGKLGVLEPIAPVLNGVFFSPRLISSRLNFFNPFFWKNMTKSARKDAIKTILGFVGVTTTSLFLADLIYGDDDDKYVEWDPRSSDFLKMVSGNKRSDFFGGFSQVVRTITQILMGERKSTITGEVKKLNKDNFPGDTRLDVLKNFFVYKLSPSSSLLYGVLDDFTTPIGDDITFKKTIFGKTIPLYLPDIISIAQDEGVGEGLYYSVPSVFGVSVQYYGTPKQRIEQSLSHLNVQLKKEERNYSSLRKKYSRGDVGYETVYKSRDKIRKLKDDIRESERQKRYLK